MASQIETVVPQVMSSQIKVATPSRMGLKKWIIIIVAAVRLMVYVFLASAIIRDYDSQSPKPLLLFLVLCICVPCEGIGLMGAAYKNIFAIRFYLGYVIVIGCAYVLIGDKTGSMVSSVVFNISYAMLVYFYTKDCKVVLKSKQFIEQQQQTSVTIQHT